MFGMKNITVKITPQIIIDIPDVSLLPTFLANGVINGITANAATV